MNPSSDLAAPLIPVIISGGSGTRLWPLSRESCPKQFLPLLGSQSLFQQTLLRARGLNRDTQAPIVVCNAAHRELVVAQSLEVGIEPQAIVLEPQGRNTAPAVAVAALLGTRGGGAPFLLVLPADHVITDTSAFRAAVHVALEAARAGKLVTFGVVPERPDTGYGYIQSGESHGGWATIRRFVEKPDLATARSYVSSGEYSWNSGMFLFSAARVLEELATHAPGVLAACRGAVAGAVTSDGDVRLGREFLDAPSISIDHAVMEKTAHGAVVPLAAGWSDVGSWSALHDVLPQDARGNAVTGEVLLESCDNCYVVANERLVAAVGLEGVVIVETEDAVLVVHRDRVQDVKRVVEALKAKGRKRLLSGGE